MEEKKLDFQAKVEELVKEKGIAFGYKRNNTIELLDPDNMNMYTDYRGNALKSIMNVETDWLAPSRSYYTFKNPYAQDFKPYF